MNHLFWNRFFLSAIFFIYFSNDIYSQIINTDDSSKLNTPCPDFLFNEVINYKSQRVSLPDFKGKLLILDFWDTYCGPCIAAMPSLDAVQNQFNGQIQILPVATQKDDKVEKLFEKLIAKKKISANTFPTAKDTVLVKYFNTQKGSLGQYVWIDQKGIIRYYSRSHDVTAANVMEFLKGGKVSALEKSSKNRIDDLSQRIFLDSEKPVFTEGNGGNRSDFLYRSVLMKFDRQYRFLSSPYIGATTPKNLVQVRGATIQELYKLAYGDTISHHPMLGRPSSYGKFWQQPILEVSDTLPFKADYPVSTKNMYTYSLSVPIERSSTTFLQKTMQNDLKNYFGYAVTVEQRMMPCWKLIAKEGALKLLISPKVDYKREITPVEVVLNYSTIDNVIFEIWRMNQAEPPIIDKTGIVEHIDITIEADMKNIEAIKKSLQKYKLDLVKDKELMKVIVIRDAQF